MALPRKPMLQYLEEKGYLKSDQREEALKVQTQTNETDIGKVRYGETAAVTTDTYPGKTYTGRVPFISGNAEFTPKSVETHAERVTLVYRIRIDLDNPSHELVPGMPADARLSALPPSGS